MTGIDEALLLEILAGATCAALAFAFRLIFSIKDVMATKEDVYDRIALKVRGVDNKLGMRIACLENRYIGLASRVDKLEEQLQDIRQQHNQLVSRSERTSDDGKYPQGGS